MKFTLYKGFPIARILETGGMAMKFMAMIFPGTNKERERENNQKSGNMIG